MLRNFYGIGYVNTKKIEVMIRAGEVVVKKIVTLVLFGQKLPIIGNEWETDKHKNFENLCVYNLQIGHNAEKKCSALKG